mgnify:CR=1 FL=1
MIPYYVPVLISACMILPILVAGAIKDVQARLFPKSYWDTLTVKIAGTATLVLYLMLVASGMWQVAVTMFGISVFMCLVFYYMGLRFGSGGDYRALMYVSFFCPQMILVTTVFSVVLGVIQVIMTRVFSEKPVPWAVSILLAFISTMIVDIVYIQSYGDVFLMW